MELSKKKSCVIVTSFAEKQPGFLDFSYRIQVLAEEYDVTVISQDELTQSELLNPKNKYIALGRKNGSIGFFYYVFKAAAYIRQLPPDIVVLLHSNLAPLTLLLRNIPICTYWNEHPTNLYRADDTKPWYRKRIAKFFQAVTFYSVTKSTLILPVGEETYDELLKRGVSKDTVQLMYHGVNDEFVEIDENSSEQVELIYVGTVSEWRGRDVMLDAMAIVAEHGGGAHLTIIGAGKTELAYCADRISTLGIDEVVSLEGRIPGNTIPSRLAKADIGVCIWKDMEWWRFNPPTKLFEYLVAGRPVLASNIRTHTRYIADWDNGFIFDYDSESLAKTILDIIDNKQDLIVVKRNAWRCGQNYLWSKVKVEFLRAVAECCKKAH